MKKKNCTNCMKSSESADLFEEKTGKKEINRYLWCRLFSARIKNPDVPCGDYTEAA